MAIAEAFFHLMFRNTTLDHTNNTLYAPSVLSCGKQFMNPCSSFFYHKETGRCALSDNIYRPKDPDLISEDGWTYHRNSKDPEPCYPGYRRISSVGLCVKIVAVEKRYKEVKADCESVPGGRVVHLDTYAKIAVIRKIHKTEYKNLSFFIGLIRPEEKDFQWTDGTPLNAKNWANKQPERHKRDRCVAQTRHRNFKWNDLYCTDRFQYICEINQ